MAECVLCHEEIGLLYDDWVPLNPAQMAHRECSVREVIGGIGHLLAHPYWCVLERDPDAGLTFHQSALMVARLVDLLGIEEVIKRGACGPAAVEEAEMVVEEEEAATSLFSEAQWEDWLAMDPQTDQEPGSA